jgi:hypothetical protein
LQQLTRVFSVCYSKARKRGELRATRPRSIFKTTPLEIGLRPFGRATAEAGAIRVGHQYLMQRTDQATSRLYRLRPCHYLCRDCCRAEQLCFVAPHGKDAAQQEL